MLRLVSFFALFLSFYNFVKEDQENISKFLKWFLILAMVVVIDDLFFLIKGGGLVSKAYLEGALAWHNQMGGFLLFVISPLCVFLGHSGLSRIKKSLVIGALIISIIALILTYSRGAWVSFILSLLLFSPLFFGQIKKHVNALIGIGVILAFIIGFLINPASIIQKAVTIKDDMLASSRSVSGNLRTSVWSNSLKMVEKSPFTGIGIGAFGSVYDSYQKDPWLYSKYAHNYFLEIAAETGIPGLVFFTSIIAVSMYIIYRNKKKLTVLKSPFYLSITIVLSASLAHSLVDIDFSRITLYSLFWIFLAMLMSGSIQKELVINIEGRNKIIYLLPLLGMIFSLMLALGEHRYQRAYKYFLNLEVVKANKSIQDSLSFNPISSKSYYLLGNIQEKQGNIDEAKLAYQKGLAYSLSSSKFYTRFGTLALNSKEYKEAEKMYKKAITLAPHADLNAYVGLAQAYAGMKDTKRQQAVIDKAVSNAFPFNNAFKGFEYMYDANGKKDEITNAYIKFIVMEINLHQPQKALKLIEITKKYLDPKNSSLPFLEENVVK